MIEVTVTQDGKNVVAYGTSEGDALQLTANVNGTEVNILAVRKENG